MLRKLSWVNPPASYRLPEGRATLSDERATRADGVGRLDGSEALRAFLPDRMLPAARAVELRKLEQRFYVCEEFGAADVYAQVAEILARECAIAAGRDLWEAAQERPSRLATPEQER